VSDIDRWLHFDGPVPDHLRPLLDALRELPPSTPEEKEGSSGLRGSEGLDAELARQEDPATAGASVTRARAQDERWMSEDGATVRSPNLDERPAAPPPADPPSPPVKPPSPQVDPPRHPEVRLVEDLKITAVLDIPAEFREQMARWPFKPRAPGPELARTMKSPAPNWRQGETAPLGDDSVAKAVAAVLPFVPVGAAPVPFPRLSLEAYASLRAELSQWPERSDEILPRYHVMNEAAQRALEAHWQAEIAASPEAYATFDKLLAEYTAWLRTQRG